jgi:hypothetical protein
MPLVRKRDELVKMTIAVLQKGGRERLDRCHARLAGGKELYEKQDEFSGLPVPFDDFLGHAAEGRFHGLWSLRRTRSSPAIP